MTIIVKNQDPVSRSLKVPFHPTYLSTLEGQTARTIAITESVGVDMHLFVSRGLDPKLNVTANLVGCNLRV
jgi:hypothetical protein